MVSRLMCITRLSLSDLSRVYSAPSCASAWRNNRLCTIIVSHTHTHTCKLSNIFILYKQKIGSRSVIIISSSDRLSLCLQVYRCKIECVLWGEPLDASAYASFSSRFFRERLSRAPIDLWPSSCCPLADDPLR